MCLVSVCVDMCLHDLRECIFVCASSVFVCMSMRASEWYI